MCVECGKMIKCMKRESRAGVTQETFRKPYGKSKDRPCPRCGNVVPNFGLHSGKGHHSTCKLKKAFVAQSKFDRLQVQEACAMFLLSIASIRGRRTKTGKLLCSISDDIRDHRWEAFKVYKEDI